MCYFHEIFGSTYFDWKKKSGHTSSPTFEMIKREETLKTNISDSTAARLFIFKITFFITLMKLIGFSPCRNYPWMCWRREKLWFDNYRRNWGTRRCRWYSLRRSDSRKSWLNKRRRPKFPFSPLRSAAQVKINIEGRPPWPEPLGRPRRDRSLIPVELKVESRVSSHRIFPISNQSVW